MASGGTGYERPANQRPDEFDELAEEARRQATAPNFNGQVTLEIHSRDGVIADVYLIKRQRRWMRKK